MKLPDLLKGLVGQRPRAPVVAKGNQDVTERVLVEALRTLSQVCVKVADVIESQRLSRAGFESQDKFLERLDKEREEEARQRREKSTGGSTDPRA